MSESDKTENVNIFKFLKEMVMFRPYHFIGNLIGSVVFFITPLVTAFAIREILNSLQGVSTLEIDLYLLVWLIPITYGVRMIVDIINVIIEFMFTMSLQVLLRSNVFNGVFEQPGANSLQGRTAGESISRFRGDSSEISWFVNFIPILFSFAIFFIIAFSVMYSLNPRVTVVVFIPFLLVVLIVNKARNRLSEYRRETRKAAGAVTGAVGDIFTNIQAIKVNGGEENLQHYFDTLSEKRRRSAVRDNTFASLIRSVGGFITTTSIGIILLLIGRDMQNGSFTVGDLSLFIFLLDWIAGFVRNVGEFISWQARAGVSYYRMYNLLRGVNNRDEKSLVDHHEIYINNGKQYPEPEYLWKSEDDILHEFKVENLTLQYPDSEQGIFNISFVIKKGEFVVISGRVGSGKSTLVKAILGLLRPQEGEIYWNQSLVTDPAEYLIPPRVVYTSQIPTLFSESVRENLNMGLENDEERLKQSLELSAVLEDVDHFEDGLETMIGPKGIKLSGGQKYRISAARMFMRESELVVVDDLSSALDVETEKKLWERIFRRRNNSYLVVSHRPSVLKRADKIIIMKNGKVDDIGTYDELLARNSEMFEISREEGE